MKTLPQRRHPSAAQHFAALRAGNPLGCLTPSAHLTEIAHPTADVDVTTKKPRAKAAAKKRTAKKAKR